jgi:hypothetical protein
MEKLELKSQVLGIVKKVMDGQEAILVENQGIIKTYVVSISSLKAKRR